MFRGKESSGVEILLYPALSPFNLHPVLAMIQVTFCHYSLFINHLKIFENYIVGFTFGLELQIYLLLTC